jgi:hypothetical protein
LLAEISSIIILCLMIFHIIYSWDPQMHIQFKIQTSSSSILTSSGHESWSRNFWEVTWNFRVSGLFALSSRYVFSYHPFYFDFHSAHIIFDVSSGFYLWNVNRTTTWHLLKMLKFAFKDVSTKNIDPTYWTILFVMLKIYFT